MTTTDIAVIPTVDGELVLLTKREATALTKKITSLSDRVEKSRENTLKLFDELKTLVQQAKAGEVHKALGVKWNAWLADTVRVTGLEREDRKELSTWLAGEGLSTRATAKMLGVSHITASRDTRDAEDLPDTVTSLGDGAERPRNGKEEEPLEAEEVEAPEEPMKAVDIVSAFNDEMAYLVAAQSELSALTGEDKWGGARKRVTNANLNNLGDVISALTAIQDDLMGDGT